MGDQTQTPPTSTQGTSGTALDPDVQTFTKAIAMQEGGGQLLPYNAPGKSGEIGRYQFEPKTWNNYAQQVLGDANAPMTPENQNQVAYTKFKQWHDAGYSWAQMASMWNAGESAPDAYKQHNAGINKKYGVQYNTPQYVKNVQKYAQQLDAQQQQQVAQPQGQGQGVLGQIGSDLGNRVGQLGTAIQQGFSRQINPISSVLQSAGAVAGGVTDVAGDVLNQIPGVKQGMDVLRGGVQAVAQTQPGQAVVGAIQNFEQAHPELANDIGAAGNIAGAIPVLGAAGAVKDVVASGVKGALTGGSDAILDAVSPRLTGNDLADAIQQQGTSKKGLLQKITLNPSKDDQAVADAVKTSVPKFNPSKPLTNNISLVKNAALKAASDLKTQVEQAGANRIYSFRELGSYLQSLPKPLSLVGENAAQYNRLLNGAMQIAQESGGKVANLLDVRKEFDNLVRQHWPNLYSNDALTPLRIGVKNIRNGLTKFTAANLPDDVGLQQKLLTQHHLWTAVENMSSKAAKGVTKEIGQTSIDRFAGRHPLMTGLIKGIGKSIPIGIGVKGAEDLVP